MYKQGDFVICASGGIWEIQDTSDGVLRLNEHSSGRIRSLFEGDSDIVRTVSSREQILDVIDRVCFIRTIQAPNDRVRREFYEEAMSKHDEVEWIKVIKSVYIRKQSGRLMKGEEVFAKSAKSYFHEEVSVVLGIPVGEVEEYIFTAVSKDKW